MSKSLYKPTGLSKSKVMTGIQCEKALYMTVHMKDLASEVSAQTQMIFDQGHAVGIEAHKHFKGGTLIDAPHGNSKLALEQTAAAVEKGALHIFEATFVHDGVLVKV